MLQISVEDIRVRCIIGVYPRERRRRQPLRIDVLLNYTHEEVMHTDEISAGVDYSLVHQEIRWCAQTGRYQTLEALAYAISQKLSGVFPLIGRQIITIRKPRALPGTAVAGVVFMTNS